MDFSIGKYTLESLTTGMYLEPRVMFREYIQNAIDSIDEAVESGMLAYREQGKIRIILDPSIATIVIEDNGPGIKSLNAAKSLLDVGNSKKSYAKRRGFRGIGRLVGLSYSSSLTFETSHVGEPIATIVQFDSEQLKRMLVPGEYEELDLKDVLKHVTTIKNKEEHPEAHYFRVILEGVDSREDVLDKDAVTNYIAETAPVPYNDSQFAFGDSIRGYFREHGLDLEEYNIFTKVAGEEEEQVYKPFRDRFLADRQKKLWDTIHDIELDTVYGVEGNVIGIVWFCCSNFWGTILNNSIKGIRFRKGNILVGDKTTFNPFMKEERFNGWYQGEIFVLDERVIPNSRRDDFERNSNYLQLESSLKNLGAMLHKTVRDASSERSKTKTLAPAKARHEVAATRVLDTPAEEVAFIQEEVLPLSKESSQVIRELQMLGKEQVETKYEVLNISMRLTNAEKKKFEKVFDIVLDECGPEMGEKVVLSILEKLNIVS